MVSSLTPVKIFSINDGSIRFAISRLNPDSCYLMWEFDYEFSNVLNLLFEEQIAVVEIEGVSYSAIPYTKEADKTIKSLADILVNLRVAFPNILAHKFQIELPIPNGNKDQ